MVDAPVATPDFYSYAWTPPVSVDLRDRFVCVRWSDGLELLAFDLWLRENVVGIGIDPATREGLIDPADLGVNGAAGSATAIIGASIGATGAVAVYAVVPDLLGVRVAGAVCIITVHVRGPAIAVAVAAAATRMYGFSVLVQCARAHTSRC